MNNRPTHWLIWMYPAMVVIAYLAHWYYMVWGKIEIRRPK